MRRKLITFFCISIICAFFSSCNKQSPPVVEKIYPVTTNEVFKADVPLIIEAIGVLLAWEEVDIKAQVSGILTNINFDDGQYVKEGTLLFKIDSRPYEARLNIAKATLRQDLAKLEYTREFARTYGNLVKGQYVARLDYLQGIQNLEVTEATIESDEATIENARINLGYTSIYAPISGYLGLHTFDEGNFIQTDGTTVLVTIRQVSPIKAHFSIASQWVQLVREKQKKEALCIECYLSEDPKPLNGKLDFIDNTVDQDAGMIILEGVIPNEDERGWPGQYVTVNLHLMTLENRAVIPNIALQIGVDGYFVFILKDDSTVELRKVVPGINYKDYRVIESGLSVGEKIVTDGQLNLVNGAKVSVSNVQSQLPIKDIGLL